MISVINGKYVISRCPLMCPLSGALCFESMWLEILYSLSPGDLGILHNAAERSHSRRLEEEGLSPSATMRLSQALTWLERQNFAWSRASCRPKNHDIFISHDENETKKTIRTNRAVDAPQYILPDQPTTLRSRRENHDKCSMERIWPCRWGTFTQFVFLWPNPVSLPANRSTSDHNSGSEGQNFAELARHIGIIQCSICFYFVISHNFWFLSSINFRAKSFRS